MVNGDYPRDWRARRNEVVERDGLTCQNCERKGGERGAAELLAFHLVPREMGGTHDTMNLVTICRSCKGAITGEGAGGGDGGGSAELARETTIDDLGDLRGAIAHLDKLEQLTSKYASQVMGEGEIDEGEIVRNEERFRIDARDVKKHLLTSRLMFTNLRLNTDSQAQQQAYAKLTERVLFLLRYELEVVNRFLDYVDILTTVKCPKCGYDADRDSKLCGECSRELPVHWECLQCRTDVDKLEDDYCEACGNELPELPPDQRRELESVQETTETTIEKWQDRLNEVVSVMENDLVRVQTRS
ncbi:HNH endonuclease [Halorientalis salina]|uniref:HNH endonuclease n=1 Tax=Halorientalis salina TaxID=2932266 RepID=UPI0010AB5CBE|nr:HNH endonuclease [Halorientalis salina]